MPDQSVELEFKQTGIDALRAKVDALAASIAKIPSTVSVNVRGGVGSGGPTNVYNQYLAYQQNQYLFLQQNRYGGGRAPLPSSAQAAQTAYNNQVKNATKVATAATQGIAGLAQAIGSLHPAAALAVGAVTAVVAGFNALQQRNLSSIQSDFLYGKAGGASARGVSESLGTDPVQGPKSIQQAIESNPVVRSAALNAGINPNGSYYGGDTNYAEKYRKFLDYLSDKHKTPDRRYAAYVADQAGVGDIVGQLSAMGEPERQKALNNRVDVSNAEQQKAAERDARNNRLSARAGKIGMNVAEWFANEIVRAASFGQFDLDKLDKLGSAADGVSGPKSAGDKIDSAADKLNRAADKLSTYADYGVGGGGRRSRNPYPPGFGYTLVHEAALGRAAAMGIQ